VTLRRIPTGAIEGKVVDQNGAPLGGMRCTAPGVPLAFTATNGAFHFDDVPVGETYVECTNDELDVLRTLTVVASQVSRLELVAKKSEPQRRRNVGMDVQQQLGDILVTSVEPGGPAARAGVMAGDIVLAVFDHPALDAEEVRVGMEITPPERPIKLTLERKEKELTITIPAERQ
jgi:hypothetical protein